MFLNFFIVTYSKKHNRHHNGYTDTCVYMYENRNEVFMKHGTYSYYV